MFANFRLYWILVMVILIVCLQNEINATNNFHDKESLKSKRPENFTLPSSNPSVCGIGFPIFDNSCTASHRYDILVSGVSPDQLGVNVILEEVRIIIEHTWDNDLDISLESPNGKIVELSSDNGGGADNYGDPTDVTCSNYTAFSMNGCALITDGVAPFIGTYIPEGSFANFHDGSDPNGIWTLQVCDDASSDVGSLQFVELIFSEAVCAAPSNLTVENFDSTAAAISWNSGNCANTIIEYGPPGFTPGNDGSAGEGMVISVPCPVTQPYILTNLIPETDYEIYVRTECTTGGFTKNACSTGFKTDCTTPPITLSENFDTQLPCSTSCGSDCEISGIWSNSMNDDFDWLVDAGGTTSANTGPSDDITGGGNYIYIETSGGTCQGMNQADLVSNCLMIGANTASCHLSFYYHMFGTGINMLSLDISTNEGINWTTLWSLSGDQGDRWEKVFVDLSAFDDEIAILRFSALGGINFRGDIAIDNIQLYGTTEIGNPSNTFYLDMDGDGFGDINSPLEACAVLPPLNYVDNDEDCDDTNDLIYPNAPEIPCNLIDENCNGMDDDGVLPDPIISNTDVCYGTAATLTGNGNLYWYDELVDGNLLFVGNSFEAGTLLEDTLFYVIDSLDASCKSQRVAVNVFVHQNPSLSGPSNTAICAGQSIDLSTLPISDSNNLGGILSFHNNTPADQSNELTSPIVAPMTTRSYYILSTTSFGCTDEIEIEIAVNTVPETVINPSDTIRICKNGSQVLTSSYLGGGIPPFSYEWSNGSSNQSIAVSAGNVGSIEPVWLSVMDALGCEHVDTVLVETIESVSSVGVSSTDVTFCGGSDGIIVVTPFDGVPPYEISWNGPVSGMASNIVGTYEIQNLEQGTYSLVITDSDPFGVGCQMNIPIVIVNGPSATVDTTIVVTNVSCIGASDGAIDISVSGNNPTFLWSNGALTEDISGVEAGFYTVTITDGICTNIINNIEIEAPDTFYYTSNIFDATCHDNGDGSISIEMFGGTAPYSIIWDNGASGVVNENLNTGDYAFSVTDANGCVFNSEPISVSEPLMLSSTIFEIQSPSCNSLSNGSIDIDVSGGTIPYQFTWSNGETTEDNPNLAEGIYSVTITDFNNCSTSIENIELIAPSVMSINLQGIQNAFCNGISDGSIDVSIEGGTEPYSFEWSNGGENEDLNNISAGEYQLLVSDVNDCTIESSIFTIENNILIQSIVDEENDVNCFENANGSIYLSTAGGQFPYIYSWNNGAQTEDIENLIPGDYFATIEDANGCEFLTDTFTISQPDPLIVEINAIESPNCNGFENGSIDVSVFGGTGSYTYSWNTGASSEDLTNIPAGVFQLTVQDENDCVASSDVIFLEEPPLIEIEISSITNVGCSGIQEGVIAIDVFGGVPPFEYTWSTGGTSQNLSGIPAGLYAVTVSDQNGCKAILSSIEVEQLNDGFGVEIEIVNEISCHDAGDGSISVDMLGGTPPFQYNWSNGVITETNTDLNGGTYNVTVTDVNGCVGISSTIELIEPDELQYYLEEIGQNDCLDAEEGYISIAINGGTAPYTFLWSNGDTTQNIVNLESGEYLVTITDDNGCTVENINPFFITSPLSNISVSVLSKEDVNCFGMQNGSINLSVNGGTTPYHFEWNTGDSTAMINQLSGGIYNCLVTDANNCIVEEVVVEIEEPEMPLTLDSTLIVDNFYCNDSVGNIELFVSGGTPVYHFDWNTGDSLATIQNLESGVYECTITDGNGCFLNTQEFWISSPPNDILLLTNSLPETLGFSDGTASVIASGGTAPYNYQWDNNTGNQTDSIALNLANGSYEVTVTDARGCSSIALVEVDFITEVEPLDLIEKIKLFPNPTQSITHLELELSRSMDVSIEVFSILGQKIVDFESHTNFVNQAIDFSKFSGGVYFVQITLDHQKMLSHKIVYSP